MKVEFDRSFAKDLKKISNRDVAHKVRDLIKLVRSADSLVDISGVRKLQGRGNYFRFRVGSYRVGVELEGDMVVFVRCLDRRDIYKRFP